MADTCAACGVRLRWARTAKGKWMPVEADTGKPHWGQCTAAAQFKKKKPSNAGQEKEKP